MPFRTALSGLNAASSDLRVTGNNIANSGTTGFKESRAEFADVFAMSSTGISRTAIGSGVKLAAVTQQFQQGNIDFTGNSLDMALSGQGFFVMDDGGARSYTRDGSFQVDRNGYVVSSGGKRLQAYPVLDQIERTFNTGTFGDLRLATTEAPPNATTRVSTQMNLNGTAPDISATTFDLSDPSTYSYSTSLSVYDSLGQSHTSTLYFRNVGGLEWEAYMGIDGQQVGGAVPMEFGPDGSLLSPTGSVDFGPYTAGNGSSPLEITFDFSRITQLGSTNSVQDGYASGRLTGIDIDSSGIVFARFTNGQALSLGQVAVANFANPQGLQQVGDNAWVETYAAGEPVFGRPASVTRHDPVRRPGVVERRHCRAAGEPDHRAAQLPGQRAGDQHRRRMTQTIINMR
jgi:flagellar hook protein FlgE